MKLLFCKQTQMIYEYNIIGKTSRNIKYNITHFFKKRKHQVSNIPVRWMQILRYLQRNFWNCYRSSLPRSISSLFRKCSNRNSSFPSFISSFIFFIVHFVDVSVGFVYCQQVQNFFLLWTHCFKHTNHT